MWFGIVTDLVTAQNLILVSVDHLAITKSNLHCVDICSFNSCLINVRYQFYEIILELAVLRVCCRRFGQ